MMPYEMPNRYISLDFLLQLGGYVMNTEDEIKEAIQDYLQDRNGFEGARSWNSFVAREDIWKIIDKQKMKHWFSCVV